MALLSIFKIITVLVSHYTHPLMVVRLVPNLPMFAPRSINFGPIDTVFAQAEPEDDTPTGESCYENV